MLRIFSQSSKKFSHAVLRLSGSDILPVKCDSLNRNICITSYKKYFPLWPDSKDSWNPNILEAPAGKTIVFHYLLT